MGVKNILIASAFLLANSTAFAQEIHDDKVMEAAYVCGSSEDPGEVIPACSYVIREMGGGGVLSNQHASEVTVNALVVRAKAWSQLGDLDSASIDAELAQVIGKNNRDSVSISAKVALAKDEYLKAYSLAGIVLGKDGADPEATRIRMVSSLKLGWFDHCVADASNIIASGGSDFRNEALLSRAECHVLNEEYYSALSDIERLSSHGALAFSLKSRALSGIGRTEEAVFNADRAVQMMTGDEGDSFIVDTMLIAYKDFSPMEGLKKIADLSRKYPKMEYLEVMKAWAFMSSKDYHQAKKVLDSLENKEGYYNLIGHVENALGNDVDALKAFSADLKERGALGLEEYRGMLSDQGIVVFDHLPSSIVSGIMNCVTRDVACNLYDRKLPIVQIIEEFKK